MQAAAVELGARFFVSKSHVNAGGTATAGSETEHKPKNKQPDTQAIHTGVTSAPLHAHAAVALVAV